MREQNDVVRRGEPKSRKRLWTNDDLAYALNNAAEFLESEEWPEDDGGQQCAANREAAKRIRRMADRVPLNSDSE